jgi:hypothetical protein
MTFKGASMGLPHVEPTDVHARIAAQVVNGLDVTIDDLIDSSTDERLVTSVSMLVQMGIEIALMVHDGVPLDEAIHIIGTKPA